MKETNRGFLYKGLCIELSKLLFIRFHMVFYYIENLQIEYEQFIDGRNFFF